MRKGLSPLVSFVIITALSIAGIVLTLTIVMPTINKMRTSGIINEAFNQLKLIDSLIKEVASEGIGSQRVFNLRVSAGEYRVVNETGVFKFEYSTKYSPFEAGLSAYRDGINFTTTGTGQQLLNLILDYNNTVLHGTARYPPGNYKLCIQKTAEDSARRISYVKIESC